MINGKKISLQPLDRSHLEMTRTWMNDPDLMRLLGRAAPVSAAEHKRWFSGIQKREDCAFFAILAVGSKRHIGNVWLWDIDRRHRKAELRIVVGDRDWVGRGVGVEAISLLCRHGFKKQKLHKIYAYVLGINPRARRAFEKAGFVVEGTLRADRWVGDGFTDVYLLGRIA